MCTYDLATDSNGLPVLAISDHHQLLVRNRTLNVGCRDLPRYLRATGLLAFAIREVGFTHLTFFGFATLLV